jgi:beta-N-acetylhexosaminidase
MPGTGRDAFGRPIRSVNRSLEELIRRIKPGGIILFTENISSIPQTIELVSGMQELSTLPLFISTDQEGGVVSRLTSAALHATVIPSQAEVGAAGQPELTEKLGALIARELRALGINMNMAPVADINTNAKNPVIGAIARAYSSDPEKTADMVEAAVEGMQRGGISAVLKHFPGHGDTKEDSHSSLAVLPHELQRLKEVEFIPFSRGIDAGVDGIMTGHISVPAVTGGSEPATLSSVLLQDILRKDLGFKGIIITDSLVMGALSHFYGKGELAVQAFKAGVDIILRPAFPLSSYQALLESIRAGEISEQRLDESVRRILRVKVQRGLFENSGPEGDAEAILGNNEHRSFVEELLLKARENGSRE